MGTTQKKKHSTPLTILQIIAMPVIVWIVFELITRNVVGVGVISTDADLKALMRTLLTSFSFALAIDCNLTVGRMDLSLGAQMYIGCIFGGNLAMALGLGGIGILVFSMIIGAISGLFVGVLFVNLRILSMVLGLGITLIFETLSFAVNKQQGLMLYGKPGTSILSNIGFILIVATTLVLGMTYFFQLSSFGFKRRAIQGNQKLASDAGINIFTNCIQCYVIGGALVACAGVFETAYTGTLTPVLGMASNNSVFRNMFPMILGLWIGSFSSNPVIGVLMGSISVKILTQGLSKLSIDGSMQNIIIYVLFLLFTIYVANVDKLHYRKAKQTRIELAKSTRKEKMQTAS